MIIYHGKLPRYFYNIGPWCKFHQYFKSSFLVQKFFCAAFMCLKFVFVIFWQKDFGAKAALKMLVKLTLGANLIKLSTTLIYTCL